jgi:hypothetical protein
MIRDFIRSSIKKGRPPAQRLRWEASRGRSLAWNPPIFPTLDAKSAFPARLQRRTASFTRVWVLRYKYSLANDLWFIGVDIYSCLGKDPPDPFRCRAGLSFIGGWQERVS